MTAVAAATAASLLGAWHAVRAFPADTAPLGVASRGRGGAAAVSQLSRAADEHGRGATTSRTGTAQAPLAAALGVAAAVACRRACSSTRGRLSRIGMRGRNYETNIRKKKGPAELKKARITAKYLRLITLALKDGQPDEELNPPLARAIKAALKNNVPRNTIDNRIKKFVEGAETVEEIDLGGYASGGAAVMVQCATDNVARAREAVATAFKTAGGNVGSAGCVDHAFNKLGVLIFEDIDEEKVIEASLEAEAEDCETLEDGTVQVTTSPQNFHAAVEAFENQGLEPSSSSVEFIPVAPTKLDTAATYETLRLLHLLDEIDDVHDVHHNGVLEDDVELVMNNYGLPWSYERSLKEK
eukprot:CAMPEP_0170599686 /NCGR_PEP_ID=MMETSP0224-20130122/16934_1 /TAXON_ID=285029 /ORGANISM="Togula jolla, Strain CCCM 725" /LENGTH=355 /DNA_ID=CAMNT_0010924363 /DNA_START=41 /DNA_END=1108 /DNA_ORIENTATION=+